MTYRFIIRILQIFTVLSFLYLLFISFVAWRMIINTKEVLTSDGVRSYSHFVHLPILSEGKFGFGIQHFDGKKQLYLISDHMRYTQQIEILEEKAVILENQKKVIPFNSKHSSMTPITTDEFDAILGWWETSKILQLLVIGTLIVFVLKMLTRFLRYEFFTIKNYRALLIIGMLLILLPLFNWLGEFMIIDTAFKFPFTSNGDVYSQVENPLEWKVILFGLTLLIFSSLVKKGMELKAEQDLTI